MHHGVSHVGRVSPYHGAAQRIAKRIEGYPSGQSTARRENGICLVHNLIEARSRKVSLEALVSRCCNGSRHRNPTFRQTACLPHPDRRR